MTIINTDSFKKITLSDATLRDGNHALSHAISLEQIERYARAADIAGIDMIEVGHGNGLGASSLQLGRSKESNQDMLACARQAIKHAKLSIHIIPGFGKLSDLDSAMHAGVDIFRVAAHCTEADITQRYIKYLVEAGKEAHGVLMMSHAATKEILLQEALKMESYGASAIILMDSAGAYLPHDVTTKVGWLKAHLHIPIGFHAHNNLGLAVANSLAAAEAGASILDATIKALGAGAGNTPLEVLVAVLEKANYLISTSFENIARLAESAEEFLIKTSPSLQLRHIASGIYGVFSGFDKPVLRAAAHYGLRVENIYRELGNRKVLAGQEDLIIDVCETLIMRKF